MRLQRFQRFVADAFDGLQVFEVAELSLFAAVGDDPLGQRRADAGQFRQLRFVGLVHIDDEVRFVLRQTIVFDQATLGPAVAPPPEADADDRRQHQRRHDRLIGVTDEERVAQTFPEVRLLFGRLFRNRTVAK